MKDSSAGRVDPARAIFQTLPRDGKTTLRGFKAKTLRRCGAGDVLTGTEAGIVNGSGAGTCPQPP